MNAAEREIAEHLFQHNKLEDTLAGSPNGRPCYHLRRATGAGAGVPVGAMPAIRIWQQLIGNPDGDV
jgi:hypothetical protein